MRRFLALFLITVFSFTAFAGEENKATTDDTEIKLDQRINEWFEPITKQWLDIVFYPVSFRKSSEDITINLSVKDSTFNEAEIQSIISTNGLKVDRESKKGKLVLVAPDVASLDKSLDALESNEKIEASEDRFEIPIVVIMLVLGALFFTIYFGFVNIRRFPLAINVVRGKYDEIEQHGVEKTELFIEDSGDIPDTIRDESKEGEVSHFQALATAVSGTVGLGNIAGVAMAIAIGGPGATFWMIVCGLLSMSTKFVECTLGVKYRDVGEDGTVYGGPMYYLKRGMAEIGGGAFGRILAGLFAILCVGASFGGGNAFQANQAAEQLAAMAGLEGGSSGFWIGVVLAIVIGFVIIGGIKRIASVTERIVPFMAGIYALACLIVIFANFSYIDDAFKLIFTSAFTQNAALGGFLGVLIQGFRRAVFSNEAGAGSAAIAHSAVKTRYPASEGIVALLEPFIDTVVICTMTALVIIFYNSNGSFVYGGDGDGNVIIGDEAVGGVNLTSMAFESVIPWFPYVLTIAVVLFAISTMISWSYYGLQSWKFLFGRSKWVDLSYKVIFVLFIVIGASVSMQAVFDFSDAMILAMVFPNMIGLLFLFPKVRQEMRRYLDAIRKKN